MVELAARADAPGGGRVNRLRSRPLPMVGWVMTSRSELAQAQRLLLGEQDGVVDELGLLAVHQAVSDRLFPGTSVLHTRLRYALFVPWLMRLAALERDPARSLRDLEFALTGRLLHGTAGDREARRGIIGGRIHPVSAAAQPASYSYWTALAVWGLIGPQWTEAIPSREAVLEELSNLGTSKLALDADGQPLVERAVPFQALPLIPDQLLKASAGVSFRLERAEREFLRRRLSVVRAPLTGPGESPHLSLLAKLASRRLKLDPSLQPWLDDRVMAAAETHDQEVLALAEGLSAVAGLARAAYLAMVEGACSTKGSTVGSRHRAWFDEMKANLGRAALRLDMARVQQLGLAGSGGPVTGLLQETQRYLRGQTTMSSLKAVYVAVESARKGPRARLSGTRGAAVHLRDWARTAAEIRLAEPLHFRWPNVVRLLNDLHGK
ncbi:hypothetical protein M2282_005956 [Variovorax boronicumulans]|nr:hypothetical protein [Variovorax boronicumulans]